jgi:anaerobic ribonucleoside-triphosphate reductase activating protein
MKIKNIIDEDFTNYKKPSMFIGTSSCDFKCDKECGKPVCQNSELAKAPTIEINDDEIIKRYLDNPITEAVVIGGLEPFDTFEELYQFIKDFRRKSNDDIIIYTGYYPEEVSEKIRQLSLFLNIIIKFGRFIPNQKSHYDTVLGVELASDNQEAVRMEDLI